MDDEYLRVAGALLVLAFICPPAEQPFPATPAGAAAAAFMAVAVCLAVLTIVVRLAPGAAVRALRINLLLGTTTLDKLLVSAATAAAAASVTLRISAKCPPPEQPLPATAAAAFMAVAVCLAVLTIVVTLAPGAAVRVLLPPTNLLHAAITLDKLLISVAAAAAAAAASVTLGIRATTT